MMKNGKNKIINFSQSLFWDIDVKKLDLQTHARFVISRVISRGNQQDWLTLKNFYGKEKIKEEVVQIRNLDKKTLNFLMVYFSMERNNFRCCN